MKPEERCAMRPGKSELFGMEQRVEEVEGDAGRDDAA